MPRAPAYSGPIRCCTAAEILRSSHTFTSTPTTAATNTVSIGRGSQSSRAAPLVNPRPCRASRKLDCRSRPLITVGALSMGVGLAGRGAERIRA